MITAKDLFIKVLHRLVPKCTCLIDNQYVDLFDQEANNYVYSLLSQGKPCMISKFGTIELGNINAVELEHSLSFKVWADVARGKTSNSPRTAVPVLCKNSGFFPNDVNLVRRFHKRVIEDIKLIDVLGSYIYSEKYVAQYLNCKRVNLDGYYAPFMWKNPWTKYLKGKKVLVVHPFVDSIKYQYENSRTKLFDNPEVLPEFKELLLVKAVQTVADQNDDRFENWFDALNYMENEISKLDFDVALIGCGAYGMCLAAHVKRMGKQAVHLAGWTQMLFGIYGERWIRDQKDYAKYINDYWIRPLDIEKPKGAEKIEGGCYW